MHPITLMVVIFDCGYMVIYINFNLLHLGSISIIFQPTWPSTFGYLANKKASKNVSVILNSACIQI